MLSVILLISLGAAEFKVRDMGELKAVWKRKLDIPVYSIVMNFASTSKVNILPRKWYVKYAIMADKNFFEKTKKLVPGNIIRWYDEKGQKKREFRLKVTPYRDIKISKNKKFVGINYYEHANDSFSTFILFDDRGEELWRTSSKPWIIVTPSPDGKWAVGIPEWEYRGNPIIFYLEKGAKKLEFSDYPKVEFNGNHDFTLSGDYWAWVIGKQWLFIFNRRGEIVFNQKFESGIREIEMANERPYIALYYPEKIVLFDWKKEKTVKEINKVTKFDKILFLPGDTLLLICHADEITIKYFLKDEIVGAFKLPEKHYRRPYITDRIVIFPVDIKKQMIFDLSSKSFIRLVINEEIDRR